MVENRVVLIPFPTPEILKCNISNCKIGKYASKTRVLNTIKHLDECNEEIAVVRFICPICDILCADTVII